MKVINSCSAGSAFKGTKIRCSECNKDFLETTRSLIAGMRIDASHFKSLVPEKIIRNGDKMQCLFCDHCFMGILLDPENDGNTTFIMV